MLDNGSDFWDIFYWFARPLIGLVLLEYILLVARSPIGYVLWNIFYWLHVHRSAPFYGIYFIGCTFTDRLGFMEYILLAARPLIGLVL